MTGEQLKLILEDVADNIFHPDPYFQGGGDMVRMGGMGYTIDVSKPMNQRISGSDASEIRQADRGRRRNTSSPAGPASTRARRARRSGTSSKNTSPA
jgi:sulfur-oxidizing protein SoxB